MVTLPVKVPWTVGVNVTLKRQLEDGAKAVPFPQVVPEARAKLPVMLTDDNTSGVVPMLVSFTDCGADLFTREVKARCAQIG